MTRTLATLTADLADLDTTWALIAALVMFSQQQGSLGQTAAHHALGMSQADYRRQKRDLVNAGRAIGRRLMNATEVTE